MKTSPIASLTDEQLADHIRMLDAKARSAQSELAHARRLMKRRKKAMKESMSAINGQEKTALDWLAGHAVCELPE